MGILDNRAEQRPAQRPPRHQIFNPINRFEYDETKIPKGMVYRWLRVSCGGKEDRENMIMADANGWTPVPATRHPELAGRSSEKEATIVRGGQMLVEQPEEYTEEAKEVLDFAARNQLESQIHRLGLASKAAAREAGVGGGNVGLLRHDAKLPGGLIE